ncbi:ThuA domain-containing protein [Agromyces seonyuensis]|uniref:Uncharacterized protein n=1 Tax=Agromyces seonyuensis TaxID=2662446 RepID=A0A6I4NTD9_9MICO|nr:ThuA domain-containing protein [Agromyces seonyuensis]MWB97500.1 hypothetical protein [Agromyces seonyuensis]
MSGKQRVLVLVGPADAVGAKDCVERGENITGMLVAQGYEVEWCASAAPYADESRLARADLVVDATGTGIRAADLVDPRARHAVLAGLAWASAPVLPGTPVAPR